MVHHLLLVLQQLPLVLVLQRELALAVVEHVDLFAHLVFAHLVVAARAGGVEGGAHEGPLVGAAWGVGGVADEV